MLGERPSQPITDNESDASSLLETVELSGTDTQVDQPRELTIREKAIRFNEINRQVREARNKGEKISEELEKEGGGIT